MTPMVLCAECQPADHQADPGVHVHRCPGCRMWHDCDMADCATVPHPDGGVPRGDARSCLKCEPLEGYRYNGGNCWDESGTSILFEVEIGFLRGTREASETFWVCETSEWGALQLLMRDESFCDEIENIDGLRIVHIEPCTRERASRLGCTVEDDDGNVVAVSMRAEHSRDPDPRVIASTLWSV